MKILTIRNFGCALLACLGLHGALLGQGTAEDYKRANNLPGKIGNKIYNNPGKVVWAEGNSKFIYWTQTRQGKTFVSADVSASAVKKQPAFDQQKLATQLAEKTGKTVMADSLPFTDFELSKSGDSLKFIAFEKRWNFHLDSATLFDKGKFDETAGPRRYWGRAESETAGQKTKSPDGKWNAYIKNYNVYVYPEGKEKEEKQLSFDGSPGEYYSARIMWSPDSKKLISNKTRPNKDRTLYLLQSSPEDQIQPILQTRNYLKPGDALPQNQPVLFVVEQQKAFPVPATMIPEQYSINQMSWRKDSRAFTFEYNQRGHQLYEVISMDAATGQASIIIKEESKTFIDYSGKRYRSDVADGKEIIWASERDGWNHLYLYDGQTGKVKNQITKGNWLVRNVVHVDEAKKKIILAASGKESGQDPYFIQYYSVNFDGTGFEALTTENGNHQATFSNDYSVFVDTYSRIDSPPVTVLRNTEGKVISELEKADITELLATGWRQPEVFQAKGRDGLTDIWGIIVRPMNFDPAKKYPVIEQIYAGPQSSFVPKTFGPDPSRLMQLAELGFIVVQIDGMGTSNRSKAFHDVCYQNLKDAGFPDRIAWMKTAAKKYPYMDLERVGVYGTSAGGQSSAGAVLFHPEFYKVAVSSCGCHDNRMDKMWWNEQWMGYPIGPQYAASSNVDNAYRLQGKLMLIVGELDDNVDPASTFQVVNALIKAKKEHELIVVPGLGHSSGGEYGEHKRRDFFVKNLLGINPPIWEGQKPVF